MAPRQEMQGVRFTRMRSSPSTVAGVAKSAASRRTLSRACGAVGDAAASFASQAVAGSGRSPLKR